jgi:hypothetical protein
MLVLETFQATNGLYHPHCCQKTIKQENKVKALDENPLNSMSAKAQKSKTAIDRLLKQTVCVFFSPPVFATVHSSSNFSGSYLL